MNGVLWPAGAISLRSSHSPETRRLLEKSVYVTAVYLLFVLSVQSLKAAGSEAFHRHGTTDSADREGRR